MVPSPSISSPPETLPLTNTALPNARSEPVSQTLAAAIRARRPRLPTRRGSENHQPDSQANTTRTPSSAVLTVRVEAATSVRAHDMVVPVSLYQRYSNDSGGNALSVRVPMAARPATTLSASRMWETMSRRTEVMRVHGPRLCLQFRFGMHFQASPLWPTPWPPPTAWMSSCRAVHPIPSHSAVVSSLIARQPNRISCFP
jgi:hypothetical protein